MQLVLFESVVQPIAFHLGAGNLLDIAYEGTGWLMVGVVQIVVMVLVISPLEKWKPAEPLVSPNAVKVDVIYTLIHRLGLFKLLMFFTFENIIENPSTSNVSSSIIAILIFLFIVLEVL